MKGSVKWFNEDKGYGFLACEQGGPDIFLHIKDAQKSGVGTPKQGESLTFDLNTQQSGKMNAINLKRI